MINAMKTFKHPNLARKLAVAPLVAGLLLAGPFAGGVQAAEMTSMGQPSFFDWLMHKPAVHKKRLHKVAFSVGTSAIYSNANLLPKTEHYVHPVVATNAIYGDGAVTCSPSGLGHRSTCGTSF
ncbi:MAG: hypothetical protein KGO53_01045 [Alphaproteobacteria bacterium]|nr:hypothetical protein [Alphaproteobacteria bacterium]